MSAVVRDLNPPNLSPRARTLLERLRAAGKPVSLGQVLPGATPKAVHEALEAFDELLLAGHARFAERTVEQLRAREVVVELDVVR